MPLEWANYIDQRVFDSNYSVAFRYKSMLYYALLNIGMNEFGPVNEIEFTFLIATLIVSALMNALIFGNVASLVAVLSRKDNEIQEGLDAATGVMNSIEMPE